jgi:hypothetical protein
MKIIGKRLEKIYHIPWKRLFDKIIKIIERQVEFIIYLESCLIVYMLISCFKFILNVKLISCTLQP